MGKKINIEIVRSKLLEMGNILLEDKYIDAKTPMKYLCLKHGIEHYGKWSDIKQGKASCPKCKSDKIREKHNLDYNYVKSYIEEIGYKLISKIYKNNKEKLDIECPIHGIFPMNFDCLKNQQQRCPKCMRKLKTDSERHDYEYVKNEFAKKGLVLLSQTYNNMDESLEYYCEKHPTKIRSTSLGNVKKMLGCRECFLERNSGDNNYLWKGGITEISQHLRSLLSEWKKQVLQLYDFCCVITKKQGALDIHHLYSFNKIVKEAHEKLNIEIFERVLDYSKEELLLLENEIMNRHEVSLGVCLTPEIHKLYHSIYGFDNTPEQFIEFKERWFNGEFSEINL